MPKKPKNMWNLEPFARLVRPATDWQSAYDQWYYQTYGIVDGWKKELRKADTLVYGQSDVQEGLSTLTLEEPPTKPQVPPPSGTPQTPKGHPKGHPKSP